MPHLFCRAAWVLSCVFLSVVPRETTGLWSHGKEQLDPDNYPNQKERLKVPTNTPPALALPCPVHAQNQPRIHPQHQVYFLCLQLGGGGSVWECR